MLFSEIFLLEKEKKKNWTQKYQIAECQLFTEVFRPVLELYNLQACKRKQALAIILTISSSMSSFQDPTESLKIT